MALTRDLVLLLAREFSTDEREFSIFDRVPLAWSKVELFFAALKG